MATDAQESPEEKIAHDTGFDLGWEAGQSALKEGFLAQIQESRLEGFQNGFAAGFKEGHVVGKNETQAQFVTYPAGGIVPNTIPSTKLVHMIANTGKEGGGLWTCTCKFCRPDLYPQNVTG